ncbi:general secretion pathway protein GspK [Planctomycetota bacterium]
MMRHATPRERGFVLIAVMLIIAVLAGFILEFHHDSRVAQFLSLNRHQASQAMHCADAGLVLAMKLLDQGQALQNDPNLMMLLSGQTPIPVLEGRCAIHVAWEAGKINVNTLRRPDGALDHDRVDMLLRLIDRLNAMRDSDHPISYAVVPAIVDWTDEDDDVTVLASVQGENQGAEDNEYQQFERGYGCKNASLDTLDELLMVKGIGASDFGTRDGVVPDINAPGLAPYLTVYGDGRILINEAPRVVIESLSDRIDTTLAEAIVENRPYSLVSDLWRVPGMDDAVYQVLTRITTVQAAQRYYTVTIAGQVGVAVRTLRVVLERNRSTGRFIPLVRWEW